ncbi:hypothetical protein CEXT_71381, partial [Caerostris extrusa]
NSNQVFCKAYVCRKQFHAIHTYTLTCDCAHKPLQWLWIPVVALISRTYALKPQMHAISQLHCKQFGLFKMGITNLFPRSHPNHNTGVLHSNASSSSIDQSQRRANTNEIVHRVSSHCRGRRLMGRFSAGSKHC